MAFTNDVFNTSGKIPATADFFKGAVEDFVTSDGITAGFSRVIGEQVFRPLQTPATPFYNRFAGRVLTNGAGWTERALDITSMRKFNPKATAQDALGFYDSSGIERTFEINVAGWCPVTIPSELMTAEMMLENRSVGQLNSMLVDNVISAYQMSIESEIETMAVNQCKQVTTLDFETDPVKAFGQIMDYATEFMGNDTHYNDLTEEENAKLITNSERIYLFINAKMWNAYSNSKAVLPSPAELTRFANIEIVPMFNALPTPLTTAESTDFEPKPMNMDKGVPYAYMCSSNKIEYRPYRGSYKINLDRNGAGDFVNEHLIYKGAIAVKPWENAMLFTAE